MLKIADFGLANIFWFTIKNNVSSVVIKMVSITELLFGAKKYGTAVDMWADGLIMAELLLRVNIFKKNIMI